jgi:DNA-binding PadR family transcriptional regulator
VIPLGEFELLVLLAVMRLRGDAYAVPVRDAIEARTGRRVARGAVYMTLDRLVRKGHLREHAAPGGQDRGGRPKRVFEVTDSGREAVADALAGIRRMQQGLDILRGRR